MTFKRSLLIAMIVVAPLSFVTTFATTAAERPGEGIKVRPIMEPIVDQIFQYRILFRALRDLGYDVQTPEEATAQTMHLALGAGDADFTAVHWDKLQDVFYQESGGDEVLEKVGYYIKGALQGYLVDKASYDAGIQNLGDLKDPAKAKRFDADGNGTADLAGCVPGWGCERVINHHLKVYELGQTVSHNQGEYNAIIADTIARLNAGKSVLYFTWTPHWVSGAMVPGKDVEWLSVPFTSLPDGQKAETTFKGKNLGFAVDSIRVVATDKFLDANPAARKLFGVAEIHINDVSAQNKKIADGEDSSKDIDAHVDAWIKANQSTYDGWLKAARAAAE